MTRWWTARAVCARIGCRCSTAFANLGAEGVERRFALADQHLASSGVFYRVYEDRNSVARAYRLSHVPLIVSAEDWVHISAGLSQRADLLETILADAYGEGRLFASGRLPAALIAGSPEYLRPLRGVRPRSGRHLNFYAADIGRDAQGRWWVLRDRTQAPSGTGYALENRIALSRGLGQIFRSYGVERLASYFDSMRSMLGSQRDAGDAGICLLTPGPHNETYFEHVYLSRYLGFRLVEGQDLSVQDDRVLLRTVGGLRPVNVLVRRLDADFADPMELNTRSRLGVPGLIGALRAGHVSVLNALGSGLMESPALLGFLPALAPLLSGSELLMPNVATWWCGQAGERQFVLDNLDSLVVTSAFSTSIDRVPVRVTATAADEALNRLSQDISVRGIDYIGQQPVHLSTMPVWERGHLVPRPFVLRVYLTATPDGWQVMPGGMALVGEHPTDTQITMQRGARTADVWTLADNYGRHGDTSAATGGHPDPSSLRRADEPSGGQPLLVRALSGTRRGHAPCRPLAVEPGRRPATDPTRCRGPDRHPVAVGLHQRREHWCCRGDVRIVRPQRRRQRRQPRTKRHACGRRDPKSVSHRRLASARRCEPNTGDGCSRQQRCTGRRGAREHSAAEFRGHHRRRARQHEQALGVAVS